jgi:hypothetical protein
MKRMRILGLALVAVFALAAVVASTAGAQATWTECAKTAKNLEGKYTGSFTDKACTLAASPEQVATGKENKYELKEGIGKGKAFKTKGGAATLHVIIPATGKGAFPGGAHVEVKCTSFKGGGQPALPNKVEKVTSAFKGCTVLAAPCQSGSKKGVIETNALSGEMVDATEETASGVAVLLHAEAGPTAALASFTCTEVASTNVLGSSWPNTRATSVKSPRNRPTSSKSARASAKLNTRRVRNTPRSSTSRRTKPVSRLAATSCSPKSPKLARKLRPAPCPPVRKASPKTRAKRT